MRRTCPSCHGPAATPVGRRGAPDSAPPRPAVWCARRRRGGRL